jgi:hypothetical protein
MGNSDGTTSTQGGGFGPPDGFMPGGAPPDGGGMPEGGFVQRDQSESTTQSGADATTTQTRMNPASLLLDPLIEYLQTKAGSI